MSVVAFLTACGDGGGSSGDDPSGSVTLSPLSEMTTTETGGTVEVEVLLNAAPTHIVTVNLTSSDTSEGIVSPATLEFTPGNWDTPQSVTVMGVDDEDDDGDVRYAVECLAWRRMKFSASVQHVASPLAKDANRRSLYILSVC